MAYVIAEPCVDVMDKSCQQVCPVDCIYQGGRKLYIHPDECIDCNACQIECPVDAIYFDQDLPATWAHYRTGEAEFFATTPDSANRHTTDSAAVTALPPRAIPTPPRTAPPLWHTALRLLGHRKSR